MFSASVDKEKELFFACSGFSPHSFYKPKFRDCIKIEASLIIFQKIIVPQKLTRHLSTKIRIMNSRL